MATFAVILPAAGQSSRFQHQQAQKPFADLEGRAVQARSAEHFTNRDDVLQTIVVVSPDDMEWFKEKCYRQSSIHECGYCDWGSTAAASVKNGLAIVKPEVEYVAVHDAARPLLTKQWVDQVFAKAAETGAALLGVPVASTLKKVADGRIAATVSRESLWEAQTPQVFRRDWLEAAYAKQGTLEPTDEAQLVEQLGKPISMVAGSSLNFKITTADDFRLAALALDALPKAASPARCIRFEMKIRAVFDRGCPAPSVNLRKSELFASISTMRIRHNAPDAQSNLRGNA